MAQDTRVVQQKGRQAPSEPEGTPRSGDKIHVLNANEVVRRSHGAQRRRRILTLASFLTIVALPIALVAYFYLEVASDRFSVESKFAIRSPGAGAPSDLLGIVSGMSSATSTATDSYIVADFIESRDLVDRLRDRLDLQAIYGHEDADFIMRLKEDATAEDIVDYLKKMVWVYYDTSSQILTLSVQAFTPEDAQAVSAAILDISDSLVNEISERIRTDTMRSAEREVARIGQELDEHRQRLAAFRQFEQDIDPAASAGEQIALLGQLERELAGARTRRATLLQLLNENAPSVRILDSEIAAMEVELTTQKSRLGTGSTGGNSISGATQEGGSGLETLTSRVGTYEDLAVDLEFLQQAYFAALASREAARLEADRAQRYLAAFVRPSLPEKSLYPKRVQNILIFAGFAFMIWGIGVMLVYIVREHSS